MLLFCGYYSRGFSFLFLERIRIASVLELLGDCYPGREKFENAMSLKST